MSYKQDMQRNAAASIPPLSADDFQIAANNLPGMLAFVDSNERLQLANQQCVTLYGRALSEIVGKHLRGLIGSERYELLRPQIAKVLAGKQTQVELEVKTRQGTRWLNASFVPHRMPDDLVGFFIHATDITDRVQAQGELEREKQLFEGVVRGVPDSLMLADLNRRITFCNPSTKTVFGYEPGELVGKSTLVLYASPEEHEEQGKSRFRPDAKSELAPVEVMMRRKSGEPFLAEMVGTILRTQQGEALGFLGLIRDITYRKEAEAAQQRNYRVLDALSTGTKLDELLRLTVRMAEEARPGMLGSILLLDEGKRHLELGYAASLPDFYNEQVDGLAIGPAVGSCGTAAYHRERVIVEDIAVHPFWSKFRDLAAEAKLRACWSEPIVSPHGEILGTLAMYFQVPRTPNEADLDLLRQTAQLAGIVVDRAKADKRVQQSEERYRSLVEASSSVIWTTSPDGQFVAPQAAWAEYTGQPWEEHQGDGWLQMIHEEDRKRLSLGWARSIRSGVSYKVRGRLWHDKSQEPRYFEAQAVPIRGEDGQIVEWVGTTTDIHEKHKTDRALRVNEDRLSLAFRATNDAIWDWDLSNDSVWWNESLQNEFGQPKEPGDFWHWWSERIHPADRDRIRRSLDAFAQGEGATDRWGAEFRFQRANGSYAHIADRALRSCDDDGIPLRVLGAMQDVSQRRALEKQVLEATSETQRAIGLDLHDGLGQELTGLSMLIDSLSEALKRKSHPERELAEKISVGIERTLHQVRNLARGMNPVDVDPHGLAPALLELADHAYDLYGVECRFACNAEQFVNDSEVATQLYRIAQEAITNAVRHGKATKIDVMLTQGVDTISLKVVDNGRGISTTDFEKGTGMRSMEFRADVIGGKLMIGPGADVGTVVTCTLPRI